MLELVRAPELQPFDIDIVTVLSNRMEMSDDFRRAGVEVRDLHVTRTLSLIWVLRLAKLMRSGRYDIFHAHSPLPASIARIINRTGRMGRVITTEHAMPNAYRMPTRLFNRWTASLDDARIMVSDAVKEAHGDHDSVRCQVVYHGRRDVHETGQSEASEALRITREELSIESCTPTVVVIANLRREKNLGLLIEAFSRVVVNLPDSRLFIVGDGPERTRLESDIESRQLTDSIQLLGYKTSVWRYLDVASVVALSSETEGLPVSVMEAMLKGIPVVSTNVGGIPEAVVDGVTGYLVPDGDAHALSDRLFLVLSNTSVRRALGEAGRTRAMQLFSPRVAARQYAAMYLNLLGKEDPVR